MSSRSRAFPWFRDGQERPPRPSYPAPKDGWPEVPIAFKPLIVSPARQRYWDWLDVMTHNKDRHR